MLFTFYFLDKRYGNRELNRILEASCSRSSPMYSESTLPHVSYIQSPNSDDVKS